jgi:hypothetical protein
LRWRYVAIISSISVLHDLPPSSYIPHSSDLPHVDTLTKHADKVAHVAAAEVAAEAADHVRTQARSFNLPPNLEDPIEEMLDLMLASFKEDREAGAERRPVRKTSHPGKTAEGHT